MKLQNMKRKCIKAEIQILIFICHFVTIIRLDITDIHLPGGVWTFKAQNGQTGAIKTRSTQMDETATTKASI